MSNFVLLSPLPFELLILLGIALLISASGFIRLVNFVSIGYAFSIAAMGIISTILFYQTPSVLAILHALILVLYGLRLGIYLLSREKSPNYRKELEEQKQQYKHVTLFRKFFIWIGVAILYMIMYSPSLFHFDMVRKGLGEPMTALTIAGIAIMLLGIGLESLADLQKSIYKAKNPKRFCDVGVYKIVRCPNYLGEITMWVGNTMAGVAALSGIIHWSFALLGLICIVLIMMGSTKRLEKKQDERYGTDPEYQKYIKTVPVLFPLLPIYSLKNVKVYIE